MRPIADADALKALTDDSLLHWTAQEMRAGVRAWTSGAAVVVAAENVAGRDRLAVSGPVEDVAPAVASVLAADGPRYRPIGDEALVSALCKTMPELSVLPPFGWMHTSVAPPVDPRAVAAAAADEPLIDALLGEAFPTSLARPGRPGVSRWWMLRDGAAVTACAADAWSSPGVGLLAGVAVAPQARGKGLGRAVVGAALAALVHDYGSAALMVDNPAARRIYESLGMSYRPLRAAAPS